MAQPQELASIWHVFRDTMRSMRAKGAAFGRHDHERDEPEDLRASSTGLAISGVRAIANPHDTEVAALLMASDAHGAIAIAAREWGQAIGRLCFLLLGSQSEADEAAQETMLAAYHGASSYRAEGTPRAWFLGIARRICNQRSATRLRQSRRLTFMIDADLHGLDASILHDSAERDAEVRAALDTLAPSDRELLVLRYDAEQSFRDIATALGIDEAAARKRVGRALVRLRARMRAA